MSGYLRLDEYQSASLVWRAELDAARGAPKPAHPWLFRCCQWWIGMLGEGGVRRPGWLYRAQMRAWGARRAFLSHSELLGHGWEPDADAVAENDFWERHYADAAEEERRG